MLGGDSFPWVSMHYSPLLEILYDLDIEARQLAEEAGLRFERTRMPNADPEYLDVLAAVVREHLTELPTG